MKERTRKEEEEGEENEEDEEEEKEEEEISYCAAVVQPVSESQRCEVSLAAHSSIQTQPPLPTG